MTIVAISFSQVLVDRGSALSARRRLLPLTPAYSPGVSLEAMAAASVTTAAALEEQPINNVKDACPPCALAKQEAKSGCKDCLATKARCGYILRLNPALQEDWSINSKATKSDFYRNNHGLLGTQLTAAIKEHVTETKSELVSNRFAVSGAFKDKLYLDHKFKDIPQQLASLYKNARRITCTITGADLWEEPDYASLRVNEETHRREHQRHIDTTSKLKKAKKEKGPATKKATVQSGAEVDPLSLNANQLKAVGKESRNIAALHTAYGAVLEEAGAPKYSDHMIKGHMASVRQKLSELNDKAALLTMMSETQRGDWNHTREEIVEIKDVLKKLIKKITTQFEDARVELNEVAVTEQPPAKKKRANKKTKDTKSVIRDAESPHES
jgi:hypothetical protein